MSVKSKMTAIADKIRSLLGITEPMGLDAMSNNIESVQTEVDIQNDLIAQISEVIATKTAVVTPSIERRVGSYTATNGSKIYINCGFQPDLVFFTLGEYKDDDYLISGCFPFAEANSEIRMAMEKGTGLLYANGSIYGTGFYVTVYSSEGQINNFNYIAVKYTT